MNDTPCQRCGGTGKEPRELKSRDLEIACLIMYFEASGKTCHFPALAGAASRCGIDREVVSRALDDLQDQHIIRTEWVRLKQGHVRGITINGEARGLIEIVWKHRVEWFRSNGLEWVHDKEEEAQ